MSATSFQPNEFEPKWREFWQKKALFEMKEHSEKPKYYLLVMFPYPSGILHVGHARNYLIGDAIARYKFIRGYNLVYPIGWDAFGLPAENQAIQKGIHPKSSTLANIQFIKKQLQDWGTTFDWKCEIATCHPGYYRWNQWLFLKFYEHGLVYKKASPANWCPDCLTTLANEQAQDGKCERCGSSVIQKYLEQWFFKISQYAPRLLDGLDMLSGWSECAKTLQRNWIGRSEGAEILFRIAETQENLPCFTTRPDTLWGVTFMSIAPEHPMLLSLVKGTDREQPILEFLEKVKQLRLLDRTSTVLEKEGVFTGKHVINPVTGDKVPLWVANYALMEYGTGAVMAVPGHDQRDFEFALAYSLPIKVVIQPPDSKLSPETMQAAYTEPGTMVNSGPFDGRMSSQAISDIIEYLQEKGMGKKSIHYRLRDWNISRQRYWGCPIPFIHCQKCGTVPVPERNLPVLLPEEVQDYKPKGKSVLASVESFVSTICPKCGSRASRETDTMDTFVDSSWYYLRYLSPRDQTQVFDSKLVNKWLPVDQYIGGLEHATKHLIYARFFTEVLHDIGLVNFEEPFQNLFNQGLICFPSHYSNSLRRYLNEEEFKEKIDTLPKGDVETKSEKMSKSKLNVISPDSIISQYGVDTMRLYILFIGPPDRDADWNPEAVQGCYRFLAKFWNLVCTYAPQLEQVETEVGDLSSLPSGLLAVYRKLHKTIQKVTTDMDGAFNFNTVIAAIMEMLNEIKEYGDYKSTRELTVLREVVEKTIVLLAPMTPHIAEETWRMMGHRETVFNTKWPEYRPDAIVEQAVEIVLQINGKIRSKAMIAVNATEEEIKKIAFQDPKIQSLLEGKTPRKVIIVANKLVNIVV